MVKAIRSAPWKRRLQMRLHRFVRKLYRTGWQYAFAYLPGKCRTAAACKYAAWSEGAGNGPEFGIELGLEPNVIYLLVMAGKIRIIYLWGHHRLFSPATQERRLSVAEINTNGLKANSFHTAPTQLHSAKSAMSQMTHRFSLPRRCNQRGKSAYSLLLEMSKTQVLQSRGTIYMLQAGRMALFIM